MKMLGSKLLFPSLVIVILSLLSCGKEELAFNPDITADTEFDQLLKTTSFFDRKETTFVMTEEEYSRLIIKRDTLSFTFQNDEIFETFSNYTHITYPYFSESPENFFMGKVETFTISGDNVILELSRCDYIDLFDDYLINTSRPNGYASTRDDCIVDIGSVYPSIINLSEPSLLEYISYMTSSLNSQTNSIFLLSNELSIDLRGSIEGCVTFISSPSTYGIEIQDFALIDFGIEISFAEPNMDFPRLKQELQSPVGNPLYPTIGKDMADEIGSSIILDNKEVNALPFPMPGMSLNLLTSFNRSISGDFIANYINEVNTTKSVDLRLEFDANNPLNYTSYIDGIANKSLSDYLVYRKDNYIGAKANLSLEVLAGLGVSDLYFSKNIGLLTGTKASAEIRGQSGTATINNKEFHYLDGCAEFQIEDKMYLYGEISALTKYLGVPNTLEVYNKKQYDIAEDPTFVGNDKTISYTAICNPDNCKDIDENSSYVRFEDNGNSNFDIDYFIKNADGNVGTFSIKVNTPTRSETIVVDGSYGISGQLTANISDANISNAVSTQDQANLWITVFDNFNECEKQLPTLVFSNECDTEYFHDDMTNLTFRAYNIDNESDQVNGTCLTTEDPIWTYQNESLVNLYSFDPDYQTINYMSYDRCECFAQKLTTTTGKKHIIPNTSTIENFAIATYDYDYSMVNGGNGFCSNFVPSGYAVKGGILCNEFGAQGAIVALSTLLCVVNEESAFFHVNNTNSDGLNDYLFQMDPEAFITVKETPKGVLAPCRLQIVN